MPVTLQPARIGALWFGIQAVWAAVLGVVLQSRVVESSAGSAARTRGLPPAVRCSRPPCGGGQLRVRPARRRRHGAILPRRCRARRAGTRGAVHRAVARRVRPRVRGAADRDERVGVGPIRPRCRRRCPDHVGRASAWMSVAQFAGSVFGLLVAAALPFSRRPLGCPRALDQLRHHPPPRARAGQRGWSAAARDARRCDRACFRGAINVGFTLFGFLFFFVRVAGVSDARTTTSSCSSRSVAGIIGAALAGRPADHSTNALS